MTIPTLLEQLESKQIRLSVNRDELVVKGRKGALDDELVALLKQHKQEIIAYLKSNPEDEQSSDVAFSNASSTGQTHLAQLNAAELRKLLRQIPGGEENVEDIYPLAPLQEGILFHFLMEGTSDPYLQSFLLAFDRKDNADRYLQAMQTIIQRHGILRTAFFWEGLPKPVQVVLRDAPLQIEEVNLNSAQDAEQQLYAHVDPQHFRINLQRAPLLSVFKAYDRAKDRWLLLHLCHHLVADHITIDTLYEEVRACLQNEMHRLPAPVPFSNFVTQAHIDYRRSSHEAFFRKMLGDVEEPTAPFGLTHTQGDGTHLIEATIALDPSLVEPLRAHARRSGVSLASLCHLAWALVIARTTGKNDVVFGTVLFGRAQAGQGIGRIMGPMINTLPVRIHLENLNVGQGLQKMHSLLTELLRHEHASLALAQRCSSVPAPHPLFSSLLNYRYSSDAILSSNQRGIQGMEWVRAEERTNYPFNLFVDDLGNGLRLTAQVHTSLDATRICRFMQTALESLAYAFEHAPQTQLHMIEVVPTKERNQLLWGWNETDASYSLETFVHQLFEAQAKRTPERTAVSFAGKQLSYEALNQQANQLAHHLRELGVVVDDRVALCLDRGLPMLIAILAVLKAGAAYLPLDPVYPRERIDFIIHDAAPRVLITQSTVASRFHFENAAVPILLIDEETQAWQHAPAKDPVPQVVNLQPHDLAYVIYTSGSTGKPKGVMVEHRALLNFFLAMDHLLETGDSLESWIATTSFSFDISILELLWPLTHGYSVEIYPNFNDLLFQRKQKRRLKHFSLFFFAAEDHGDRSSPYRLLLDASRLADQHGFSAVWTPERHFHSFGGIYPNPSVTGAAVAAITERVEIRAGSVVLPLHDPLRVAEEWSVVDNLSQGRVSISFASGWNTDDFVLQPNHFQERRKVLLDSIQTVRALWRGDTVLRRNGANEEVAIKIHPRPIQPELKIWLTAAGNPETFREAGRLGARVLTHLLGQDFPTLSSNIAIYREAYRNAGHEGDGHVALMLHTFVGKDAIHARDTVRDPFCNYLEQSIDLLKSVSRTFDLSLDSEQINPGDLKGLARHAFERYSGTHSLIGDKQACLQMLSKLADLDIDEVACLIDFGVAFDATMDALSRLIDLKDTWLSNENAELPQPALHGRYLQCTPSLASALVEQLQGVEQASLFQRVVVGGEAFPLALSSPLQKLSMDGVLNMYGPTETTIWSATYHCTGNEGDSIPIGKPIANTRIYILDAHSRPTPIGVAGEIYIGGEGVARGYLNRPELTAERFLKDPFSASPNARMYKTGDLGRWRPDGNIQFLGRNDFQVKIRGFRIELGEIEARLIAHPSVQDAVVIARESEDQPGDKRLVAYVVPRNQAQIEAETLREHLASALPEYMIPAAYVSLDALPLSPNGKLDRKALPAPGIDAFSTSDFQEPQGETEILLAGLWQELLHIDRVGRFDNFFQLGGHSLLAISLIERMRQAGLQADIRILFQASTLAQLAASLRPHSQLSIPPNLIPQNAQHITPEMLPLLELSQPQIDQLLLQIPGGSANVQDIYPLAPLQEGILFHFLLADHADPYVGSGITAFRSKEQLDRYLQAMQAVIDRHDILRTAFFWEGLPEPVQVVLRKAMLQVDQIQLDSASDAVQQLYASVDPRRFRFNLQQAPLLRIFTAYDAQQERWLILLLLHHIVGDKTTTDLLHDEVRDLLKGELLPAPVPFRNLVAQGRLGVSQEEHESFFREMLGDIDKPTTPFGLLHVQGDGTGILEDELNLPAPLVRSLKEQARRAGVSIASICHLAWALVLAKTTGNDDVVFGTLLFGRMQAGPGAERIMGLSMNMLPLRIQLRDTGVLKALRRTHALLGELMRHEHASLALAQRCSAIPSPLPLFSSLLNYRYRSDVTRSSDLAAIETLEWIRAEERTNYPITFCVDDNGADFKFIAQVDAAIDPLRVCQFMQTAVTSLVNALESAPEKSLCELEVLPTEERKLVLQQWNNTAAPYPNHLCVHQLFEQQAARTPDRTALVYEDQSMSYGELNRRANELAHYLLSLGLKPDERVAICMERSLEMIVAILAVLKAGGAYVPLDPTYPADRLHFMLQDSQPLALLTQSHLAALIPEDTLPLLLLDQQNSPWSSFPDTNSDPAAFGLTSRNLAYIIYTSGSTGTPKGVMIEHRNTVNFLTWARNSFPHDVVERTLFSTSLNFDLSVFECFLPIISGSTIQLIGKILNLPDLPIQTTLINTVPSAIGALLEIAGIPATTRVINLAGEPLKRTLVERLFDSTKVETICNLYGPSETTTYSTWVAMQRGEPFATHVGKPIANTRIYILDEYRQPVPLGVIGELYIGGSGIARGYLNRPELTAERFLKDPFVQDPQARIYKTGDLARYLPDGNIEFLGRNDFQVKIRGFRIELGEIEARLNQLPPVRDAVVIARQDQPGDKQLVAYLVPQDNTEQIDPEALRNSLAAHLPDYMLPAAYVFLEALPLTPNGKLDRQALPAPGINAFSTAAFEEPEGETEILLAGIWQELLHIDRVGRFDNFFQLGGHSLLAVSLIERIRQAGLRTDIRSLFQAPTLAQLAACVKATKEIVL